MRPKPNIVHLPVYQPGKSTDEVKKELGLDEIIKLASNENPFGCSPKVKEALMAEFENTQIYPDGASLKLTEALSRQLGVNENQLIFGAGSDEVVLMAARAFLEPGDETVMASHTFPQYKHNAEVEAAKVIEVPLKEGKHDLETMLSKVNDKTKIVWICVPNNPTGTINTHEEIKSFMKQVPKSVLVVLDEAYVEYNTSDEFPDSLGLLKEHDNILILRTFSKIYGLASLRIGYGIGRAEVIHTINQVREPFNTTRYAQAAAVAALDDQQFIADCREKNEQGRQFLQAQFEQMGIYSYPSYGNFIMVDVKKPAEQVFHALLKKGIIVRGGHALNMPTCLRITIGSQRQNEKLIEALSEVLDEIKVEV